MDCYDSGEEEEVVERLEDEESVVPGFFFGNGKELFVEEYGDPVVGSHCVQECIEEVGEFGTGDAFFFGEVLFLEELQDSLEEALGLVDVGGCAMIWWQESFG